MNHLLLYPQERRAQKKWTDELESAFQEAKQMASKSTMLTYPDWSKPFDIHTDASDFQLGAVISQEGKPIAFFSRKLNSAQKNYTTTKKELLSIVECVKEFRNILFGYHIRVFLDHKNLVHAATMLQSQRVMWWRLILEEFGPDIQHIKGEDNIVADAISRLPTSEMNELQDEFLALEDEEAEFPLDLQLVRDQTQKELNTVDSPLNKLINDKKAGYNINTVDDVE